MTSLYLAIIIVILILNSVSCFTIGSGSIVRSRVKGGQLSMGNNAKFGIFSPAVIVAKYVLGEAKLNKV